jgi:hypothetical protein
LISLRFSTVDTATVPPDPLPSSLVGWQFGWQFFGSDRTPCTAALLRGDDGAELAAAERAYTHFRRSV